MRLVDADAIPYFGEVYGSHDRVTFKVRIDALPTVDAVEVVRCKDCKYRHSVWHKDGRMKDGGYYFHYCELDTGDPFELGRDAHIDDWYCADGELKEVCV